MKWHLELPKVVKDCITGPDGRTYDAIRIAFVIGVCSFIGYAGSDLLIHHRAFDPVAFGSGFGVISGGTGAALAVKQAAGAEPSAPDAGGEKV